MKNRSALILLVVAITLFSGCSNNKTPIGGATNTSQASTSSSAAITSSTATNTGAATSTTDAVTSASIVDNAAAFEKAIGTNGTWIIAITKDLTIDKDISLDGEYKNGKKDDNGKDLIQRKVALYAQDKDRKITARYTLTAPKFTITSPEASIQHGTFKGDLYVNVKNFKLIDATVDGNVYFMSDEAKSTFNADATSKITGKQELKK